MAINFIDGRWWDDELQQFVQPPTHWQDFLADNMPAKGRKFYDVPSSLTGTWPKNDTVSDSVAEDVDPILGVTDVQPGAEIPAPTASQDDAMLEPIQATKKSFELDPVLDDTNIGGQHISRTETNPEGFAASDESEWAKATSEPYQYGFTAEQSKADAQIAANQLSAKIAEDQQSAEDEYVKQRNALRAEKELETKAMTDRMKAEAEAIMNARINPSRWWSSQSSFGKAMTIASGALIGYGALRGEGLEATRLFINQIGDAIDDDLAAQRSDVANRSQGLSQYENVYEKIVASYADREAGLLAGKATMLGIVERKYLKDATESKNALIRANAQAAGAAIAMERDKLLRQAEEKELERRFERSQAALSRGHQRAMIREQRKPSGTPVVWRNQVVGYAPTSKQAGDLQNSLASTEFVVSTVDDVLGLATGLDNLDAALSGDKWLLNPQVQLINQKINEMGSAERQKLLGSALSKSDLAIWNKILSEFPQGATAVTPNSIKVWRNKVQEFRNTRLQRLGIDLGGLTGGVAEYMDPGVMFAPSAPVAKDMSPAAIESRGTSKDGG